MQQLNWIKFDEKKNIFRNWSRCWLWKKGPENWSKKFLEKWECVLIFLLNNKQEQITLQRTSCQKKCLAIFISQTRRDMTIPTVSQYRHKLLLIKKKNLISNKARHGFFHGVSSAAQLWKRCWAACTRFWVAYTRFWAAHIRILAAHTRIWAAWIFKSCKYVPSYYSL